MIPNSSAVRLCARWARAGHHITYQLLTCGDKGFNEFTSAEMTTDALCAIRHAEQIAAAKVIGVDATVHFLDCPDGYLVPDLNMRREIVRVIRKFKPDILVTCDPQTLFAMYGINHPGSSRSRPGCDGCCLSRCRKPCLFS